MMRLPNRLSLDFCQRELTSEPGGTTLAKQATGVENCSTKCQDLVRRLTLEIRSLNVCLEDFIHVRAELLGITGTQLTILMAVMELNTDGGAPAGMVAKLLKVDPSFITLHSKELERVGYMRRKAGAKDGRVVQLSLTERARRRLASIAARQRHLDQFVLGELGTEELTKLSGLLAALRKRLERARVEAELNTDAVSARGRTRR
ncbi:MarR family winged helix-turn-helix transcriptional regulator [Bradyrhizobium sp. CIR3A]|uniref:MarR family winged helix-turn-helix transcriptional regulator n=1 Tax=Bradyrhizobium sp. CIR3A TaxID=2663838 RepID=UPI0017D1F6B0|nr:MarR family transcriptional regulator [Bradyrhizobium sp. CIR3A]MBB4258038.1 DNA-binding MarR family transcriptional regulator [Bradyrhizobium sp. CIR3A]